MGCMVCDQPMLYSGWRMHRNSHKMSSIVGTANSRKYIKYSPGSCMHSFNDAPSNGLPLRAVLDSSQSLTDVQSLLQHKQVRIVVDAVDCILLVRFLVMQGASLLERVIQIFAFSIFGPIVDTCLFAGACAIRYVLCHKHSTRGDVVNDVIKSGFLSSEQV